MDFLSSLSHAWSQGDAGFVPSSQRSGQSHLLLPSTEPSWKRHDRDSLSSKVCLGLVCEVSSKMESSALFAFPWLWMGFVLGGDAAIAEVTHAGSWQAWVTCIRNCTTRHEPGDAERVAANSTFQSLCIFLNPSGFRRWALHLHLQNTITVTTIKENWHFMTLPLFPK